MFKKNQQVVKVFTVNGIESAVVSIVKKATAKFVQCDGDDHIRYGHDARELDPAPGFTAAGISSRLIAMDGE